MNDEKTFNIVIIMALLILAAFIAWGGLLW